MSKSLISCNKTRYLMITIACDTQNLSTTQFQFFIKIWSFPIHYILYTPVSIQVGLKFTMHCNLISHLIQWRWLSDLFFTIVNIHITIKNMKISSCSKTLNMSTRSKFGLDCTFAVSWYRVVSFLSFIVIHLFLLFKGIFLK